MKKKQIAYLSLLLAVLLAALVAGCTSVAKKAEAEGKTVITVKEDDFKSEPGILKITNFSSSDVAIFVGKVERRSYIGAIKAHGSRTFDLSKVSGIPRQGAFLFRATTYEQYNKKGVSGVTEEDVIYTGLIAYDLDHPDRTIEQDIFRNIDEAQNTFIYVSNVSPFVLELRLDSSDGEKVAVLSPGQRNKKLWIKPQEDGLPYRFFPTYVYVDPRSGDMNAMTDQVNLNGRRFEPQAAGINVAVISFEGPGNTGAIQYNVAFIRLQNDTPGLINFQTAKGNYRKNDRGTTSTMGGQSDTYQIASDSGANGRLYSGLTIEHDAGFMPIQPYTFRPGYIYEVLVTLMNGTLQYDIKTAGSKSKIDDARVNLFME